MAKYHILMLDEDNIKYEFYVDSFRQFELIFDSFTSHIGIKTVVVNSTTSEEYPISSDLQKLFQEEDQ